MSQVYITREGDVVDWVVWNYYGSQSDRLVERVLEANPGLADYGAVMPGGVKITLPDFPNPKTSTGVRLWD